MESSPPSSVEQPQTCAICLDSLLMPRCSRSDSTTVKVGALTPCGHVFHKKCYSKWYSAQKRRSMRQQQQQQRHPSDSFRCKCPMCNVLSDDFVQLFLEGHFQNQRSSTSRTSNGNSAPNSVGSDTAAIVSAVAAAAAAAAAVANDSNNSTTTGDDESQVLLLAQINESTKRLDRVKDKLNKYRKENKALEKKLEDERRLSSESLERIVERHCKERRSWKRQQSRLEQELHVKEEEKQAIQRALDQRKEDHRRERRHWRKEYKVMELTMVENKKEYLEDIKRIKDQERVGHEELENEKRSNERLLSELGRTIELQVEERRRWEQRMQTMEQELEKARDEKEQAEARISKAVKGIQQMQIYNDARRNEVQRLTKEKMALMCQVVELKSALDEEVVIEFEQA